VLVVGGGPAGMECARVLGERGYDVHLREAEDALGGHWKNVVRMPRLEEWARVITYREAQLAKLNNVEVHLGVGEMSADDVLGYGADKVVIATGAQWLGDGLSPMGHSAIPGADTSLAHCLTPMQVMNGKQVPGENVIVLDADGHFTALALAEMMADQGKAVTYVTCLPEVAEYSTFTLEIFNNKRMMQEKNIAHHRDTWVERIEEGKITLYNIYRQGPDLHDPVTGQSPRNQSTETMELPCDAVILVTARASNDALYNELRARRGEWAAEEIEAIYRIGDCHAPRQALNAIFDGHRLAREFDSAHPQYPLPWIRERQVWQAETYPKLGDARVAVEPR
ncbi:MAG: FAD-dependent oxidoreductase, partial [Rhodospirillaceae bacterium]|nr:FAD-dependent oxidoreductase [Rhodospirillaceae bacterium]